MTLTHIVLEDVISVSRSVKGKPFIKAKKNDKVRLVDLRDNVAICFRPNETLGFSTLATNLKEI